MSSILDALKKVEADKAARLAQEDGGLLEAQSDPGDYADVPEPLPTAPQTNTVAGLSPRLIIAGILILAVCIVVVSVSVSLVVTQRVAPAQVAAVVPAPAAPTAIIESPAPPAEEAAPEAAIPEPPPEPAAIEAPAPAAAAPKKPEPKAPPRPAMPAPAIVAEAAPPSAPEPVAADTGIPLVKDMEPVDVDGLKPLRTTDRIRYGLENMKINMLREPSGARPNGLAVINLVKYYVGEVITGTRARLIGVAGHGIGIEMIDNGERYFVAY